jgi:hypothetical protein
MTGSGLGNFGIGGMGIMGQQDWQKRAREEAFGNLYSRGLQMAGGSQMAADPMQQFRAGAYATSFFPQGATFTGGSTAGGGMYAPFAGTNASREIGGTMRNGEITPWWKMGGMLSFPTQTNTRQGISAS